MADDADPAVTKANDRIRDAAKWLITSSAAVGVVLLAGSQLSNIGKLDTCLGMNERCLRLPIAGLGAALGLGAVVFAIWKAVRLLLPVVVTLDELEKSWRLAKPPAEVQFFKDNPRQLGADSPAELAKELDAAWDAKDAADDEVEKAPGEPARALAVEKAKTALTEVESLNEHVGTVTDIAQNQRLRAGFEALLPRLVGAAIAAALGIVVFAWASNPPDAPSVTVDLSGTDLSGADLQEADLRNADLSEADLSGTDLEGADLRGAKLKDVVWSGTTCPDGTDSDDHDNTCAGHLDSGDG